MWVEGGPAGAQGGPSESLDTSPAVQPRPLPQERLLRALLRLRVLRALDFSHEALFSLMIYYYVSNIIFD